MPFGLWFVLVLSSLLMKLNWIGLFLLRFHWIFDVFFQCVVFKVQTFLLGKLVPDGDGEIRTLDPLLARQVLSQLSYTPTSLYGFDAPFSGTGRLLFLTCGLPMGLSGLEPPTSRLSGVRSNRLSYKPSFFFFHVPAASCFPMPSPA
jgi:hypothetical protein